MKRIVLFLAAVFTIAFANAQAGYLPYAELTTLEGARLTTNDIISSNQVTILVFWKSCNQKCCQQLDAIHEIWQDSLAEQGVQMIGICIDGLGSWDHVRPLVYGNSWEFDTYIDVNCDLKRAMNVTCIPCTVLLDQQNNIICRYNGYCSGSEKMLCEKIYSKQLVAFDDGSKTIAK